MHEVARCSVTAPGSVKNIDDHSVMKSLFFNEGVFAFPLERERPGGDLLPSEYSPGWVRVKCFLLSRDSLHSLSLTRNKPLNIQQLTHPAHCNDFHISRHILGFGHVAFGNHRMGKAVFGGLF